jgi:signal transduction histidine kinase
LLVWLISYDITPGVICYEATYQSLISSDHAAGVFSFESIRASTTNKSSLYFGPALCHAAPALFRRLLLLLLTAVRLSAAEPVLDTIAKVRALPQAEAEKGLPVRIDAMVIYYDPVTEDNFMQDDTAATYMSINTVENLDKVRSLGLEPGSRVRIEAVTKSDGYSPDLILKHIELIGKGALPEPRKIGEDELLSPALDCQWVEVPALVTGVESDDKIFTLVVEVHGWKLKARLPRDEHSVERAAALMQRTVRLQGLVGTLFSPRQQMTGRYFFVPSFDHIIPTDSVAPDSLPPLRKVGELLRFGDPDHLLVRVEGVVTQTDRNDFYLRDDSGSVMVHTTEKESLLPGDRVSAEGFAAIAPFRPGLRARKVVVIGHTGIPQPMTLDFGRETLPLFQAELIELDADYLARGGQSGEFTLQCRIGARFFEALMPPDGTLPHDLAPGDRVHLTGICELTTTHPLAIFENVDGFRLHLPKVGGVVILQHAPWWTLKHLLIVIGIMSIVAFLAAIWAVLLRTRVQAQTKIIGNQIQQVATQDERQRIARELHDTVEQELAGISMQLDNISADIRQASTPVPAPFPYSIEIVQKMLQHCRSEARSSIRDLRNIELEQRGLSGALEALLPPVAAGCGADFQMRVTGEARPLARIVETHLLRIAQESVANAAHHAAACKITVDLDYTPEAVALAIHDDGRGLDPDAPVPHGHFGLRGIRERANKLFAALDIEGAPGKGTTIRIIVPAKNHETHT